MKHAIIVILLMALLPLLLNGQSKNTDSKATETKPDAMWSVYPSFSWQWPGGDLADRFGPSATIGPGLFYKTASNWIFNADINFIFGNVIREDSLIQNLINSDGFVIDDQGHYAEVSFFERGFYSTFRVGKVIPIFGSNPNSGLLLMAGVGYLQHKINIQVTNKAASPLKDDYKKGYDRYSNGLSTVQFVGYIYHGKSRLANFFAGVEVMQAWIMNRRSMNFDTMRRDDTPRFDMLIGPKVGWIIPFNKRMPEDYYYY
ncbi:MAG: hypothetical protein EOM83_10465 [Clostridia bacterium]|nr:hypothetical protein [Clostridia bacterium]